MRGENRGNRKLPAAGEDETRSGLPLVVVTDDVGFFSKVVCELRSNISVITDHLS